MLSYVPAVVASHDDGGNAGAADGERIRIFLNRYQCLAYYTEFGMATPRTGSVDAFRRERVNYFIESLLFHDFPCWL